MIKVKICGITNEKDAFKAIDLGVSALGFIFYTKSPRYIPPVKASDIINSLPPFVNKVGVFVNMNIPGILAIIKKAGLSSVQLHGDETPEYCYELNAITSIPIIKAFRIKDKTSLSKISDYRHSISAVLLDTFRDEYYGGTGEIFNWNLLKALEKYEKPIILSGGLNHQNIEEAYLKIIPYAFDFNSGLEISPGIKDHYKMEMLFKKIEELQKKAL